MNLPILHCNIRGRSRVVILVHGIFSDHTTFEPLIQKVRQDHGLDDAGFGFFDYNFRQSIAESGQQLAVELQRAFGGPREIEVNLVGHSMGGLVCRLALLQMGDRLPFVKRLIMLGTPNHGTLSTAQLGLLAHMTREATGKIWAVMTRKTGIKELTEIGGFMRDYLSFENTWRTQHVGYVTVPGLFYHRFSGRLRVGPRGTSLLLQFLNLGFELTKMFPFWEAGLERPHDGIVEESSVLLRANTADLFSERDSDEMGPYLHVIHQDHKDADHLTIHGTGRTARILAEILNARDLITYKNQRAGDPGYKLSP